ncbi:hypothetical protein L1049_023921 [Liquidambar formosana]|uniref:Uncharacterized protein n=1 Tax=Liquidambar formosana TaxID=63359 RepID=A0AAP0RV90_LIQFO
MRSKCFIFVALLLATLLLISSEVAARDLAETSTSQENAVEAKPDANGVPTYGAVPVPTYGAVPIPTYGGVPYSPPHR